MIYNNNARIMRNFCNLIGSLDQSTTSTKFSLFKPNGQLIKKQIYEHKQICPMQGWLQHDPIEIIANTHKAIDMVVGHINSSTKYTKKSIQGIGICNQRQTIVCWDQQGNPMYNAIVWCDSRTKQICEQFKTKNGEYKHLTGLPISSYFSIFKIIWLLKNIPNIRNNLNRLKFGTIDTWIIYKLTGNYITDITNASRTHLCQLSNGQWNNEMLNLCGLKKQNLPKIVNCFEQVGIIKQGQLKGIPISCVMGDQQSSAYAHNLKQDQMKITYGTGCFMLSNIGTQPKIHPSFITTILNSNQSIINYAYQASVECGGGTLNWAKKLNLFTNYSELNNINYPSTQQLFFYPSFGSIFAPYWLNNITGSLIGLNYHTTHQHILLSILQSITFRLYDNIKINIFNDVKNIFVDGGMTKNQVFMSMQATVFNKNIQVKQLDTCWGVAKGVMKNQCIFQEEEEMRENNNIIRYQPKLHLIDIMHHRYQKWCQQRKIFYNI